MSNYNHLTAGRTEAELRKLYPSEYRAWNNALHRCYDQDNTDYKNYGNRGITVSLGWRCGFKNFLRDMGPKPSADHSLDRIDTDGNYQSSNCRWATKSEQMLNRRPYKIPKNRFKENMLTWNGKTQNLSQWAKELDISITTLSDRFRRGWDVERILSPGSKRTGRVIKVKNRNFSKNIVLQAQQELEALQKKDKNNG